MQQVRFKPKSMEAARHGNDRDYYLFAINGDYAVVKYIDGNRWRTQTVNRIALEVVEHAVKLPVKITDAELRSIWLNAGGTFHGPITETATMTEARIFDFIKDLL